MKKSLFYFFVVIFLSGCANQVPLNKKTQSGKPEGIYEGTTKSHVKDALVEYCNNHGMMIMESTNSLVLCSKETEGMQSIMTQLAIGNSYSTTPVAKIKFSIGEVNRNVKVWADMWVETQMAMGQVNQMKINSNETINRTQNMLDNLNPQREI